MATDGFKRLKVSNAPPRMLNVEKFAESRSKELEALHLVVANRLNNDFRSRRSKRRRTTSHDNRAAKTRFRKKQKVGDSGENRNGDLDQGTKKVPRYIRRRMELKKNPQSGFCASGDGTKRLRTHVWHAKRFTMTKLWGFHLPLGLHGRGQGSRAALKWLKTGVVVHDASYYGVVQLEGPEDMLLSTLSMVMLPSPSAHLEELLDELLSGVTFASSLLHHAGSPSLTIAPVSCMWRPLHQRFVGADVGGHGFGRCDSSGNVVSASSLRQLWMWIHAAAFEEGFDALKAACQRQAKIDDPTASINCISLEGQLAKFELMGPKAYQLLQKVLRPVHSMSVNPSVLGRCSLAEAFKETQLHSMSAPGNEDQIRSSSVVFLAVCDPRALTNVVVPNTSSADIFDQLKGKEVKLDEALTDTVERNTESDLLQFSEPEHDSFSDEMDLWNVSKYLCQPLEESILCMEKHHQRLASFFIRPESSKEFNGSAKGHFSRFCPIHLLQRNNLQGSTTRWSIILPLSWAKAFWIPLISGGARAIGLREKRWIASELALPNFPSEFPDSDAYYCFMATEAASVNQKANLRPPSMRALKLPIPPPWECAGSVFGKNFVREGDHSLLCNELCPSTMKSKNSLTTSVGPSSTFKGIVARTSSSLIHFLEGICGSKLLLFPCLPGSKQCMYKIMKDEKMLTEAPDKSVCLNNLSKNLCFVRVLLHAYRDGVFEDGAVVCAPKLADIKLWTSGLDHKKVELQVPPMLAASYFVQQPCGGWKFQVPEEAIALESHRWPLGFITNGFVRGSKKPVAGALCEVVSLARLRDEQWRAVPAKQRRKEIFVLVRNIRSTAYKLARASIVLEHQEVDLENL